MADDPIVEELKALRDREGVDSTKNIEELGPGLRERWVIPKGTGLSIAMRVVREKMNELASLLDGEDKLIFRAMFRLDGGPETLGARRKSLADKLRKKGLSPRAIQDRENAVIARAASRLAQVANTESRETKGDSVDDDTLYVSKSPFVREFHLDGFYWNRLIVRIKAGADRGLQVYEHHTITATKAGVDRIGMIMCPNFVGLDSPEIRTWRKDTVVVGIRRPDTLTTLSESMTIRTVWLTSPLSAGEEDFFVRRFPLPPGNGSYTVSPLCRFDGLSIELDARALFYDDNGEDLEDSPWLEHWVIPGLPTLFIPDIISHPPFQLEYSSEPSAAFSPQHYCWSPKYPYEYRCEVHFENLTPGLTYGIGWTIDEDEDETPRPQDTEDGESVSGESE